MIKKITIENTEKAQTIDEKLEVFRNKINQIIESLNAEKASCEVCGEEYEEYCKNCLPSLTKQNTSEDSHE